MEEKILQILSLCIQAKKNRVDVFFKYSPHVNEVSVYAYKDFNSSMFPDEIPDHQFIYSLYLNGKDVDENLLKVKETIENLIIERKNELCKESQEQ